MHGYMLKLGNPFLTQWQRRYFYLFPNRLEWRGEGESRVSHGPSSVGSLSCGLSTFANLLLQMSSGTCVHVFTWDTREQPCSHLDL